MVFLLLEFVVQECFWSRIVVVVDSDSLASKIGQIIGTQI
jgi:hypothetical protein